MSMLSSQIDALREASRTYQRMGNRSASNMLRDAADTIWQLRDDLQRANAENAKLRELIVRCCDCESAREHYEGMDVWWCGFLAMYVGSSDFCCWGKKREDA